MSTKKTKTISHTWDGQTISSDEEVRVSWLYNGEYLTIEVEAPFHNDPKPSGPAASFDGLWDYEVVEVFIAGEPNRDGDIPYLEVELSPHGHFLVLELLGERQRMGTKEELDFSVAMGDGCWQGKAHIPLAWLPPTPHRWNAYAIHGVGDRRRYLAMVPTMTEKPDFHHLACFVEM